MGHQIFRVSTDTVPRISSSDKIRSIFLRVGQNYWRDNSFTISHQLLSLEAIIKSIPKFRLQLPIHNLRRGVSKTGRIFIHISSELFYESLKVLVVYNNLGLEDYQALLKRS